MRNLITYAKTGLALGADAVATVALYRLVLRLAPFLPKRSPPELKTGAFFTPLDRPHASSSPVAARPELLLFGKHPLSDHRRIPDWLRNPLTGVPFPASDRPWYEIGDFDPAVGDIKQIWELSRMNWAVALAVNAREGDGASFCTLNDWLSDWATTNPPFFGPNWKCGQEAAIRVLNLTTCSLILGSHASSTPALKSFLKAHARRIRSTGLYARAQRNNHATSEACAAFVAGALLAASSEEGSAELLDAGRRDLERAVADLIAPSGCFSQYSVTYHRLMLDSVCIAELVRRALRLDRFSSTFYTKMTSATDWLASLVNEWTGDAPNIGANDGAHILQLPGAEYRDFRPSVQLASSLFRGQVAYVDVGSYDRALQLFDVPRTTQTRRTAVSRIDNDGGFAVLVRGDASAVLRFPRFRFRPSHADALHLDLSVRGVNVLSDGGTYSYNSDAELYEHLAGVRGHNTVQFDEREQMPRLGRFLYGNWLKTDAVHYNSSHDSELFCASYTDHNGCRHQRMVELRASSARVTDDVSGFSNSATIRWRLPCGPWRVTREPGSWRVDANPTPDFLFSALIPASSAIQSVAVVDGWESRYYLHKQRVSVLELELSRAACIATDFEWTVAVRA